MTDRINRDARNIRKLVREAEAVTDEAMMACSKLKLAMLQARGNPSIGSHEGQSAMVRLSKAEQQALAMSNNLLRLHAELSDIARETAGVDENVPTVVKDPGGVDTAEPAMA